MLFDSSYIIPTGVGLPLNLSAQASSIMRFQAESMIDATNFRANPLQLKLKGKLAPRWVLFLLVFSDSRISFHLVHFFSVFPVHSKLLPYTSFFSLTFHLYFILSSTDNRKRKVWFTYSSLLSLSNVFFIYLRRSCIFKKHGFYYCTKNEHKKESRLHSPSTYEQYALHVYLNLWYVPSHDFGVLVCPRVRTWLHRNWNPV